MTSRETALLLRGYYKRDMQMAILVAAVINSNRGRHQSPVKVESLSVFERTPENRQAQSAERQRHLLEAITIVMGGEVKGGGRNE